MSKAKLLVIICVFLLYECTTSEEKNTLKSTENIFEISLNDLDEDNEDLNIVKNVSYIFLETKKNSIIGKVDKILFSDNKFFLFDKDFTRSVFIFDEKGRYINKIDKLGKGPGEYGLPLDFDVDSSGNVYIYDNMKNKIIKYDTAGEYYDEFRINNYFEEFGILDMDNIVIRNAYRNATIIANLGFINLNDKKLKVYIKGGEINDGFNIPRFSAHYLFKSGNVFYYYPRFTNSIYQIRQNNIFKSVIFDQSLVPTIDYIKNIIKDPRIVLDDHYFITDIRDIYKIPGYIILKYQRGFTWFLIISEETGAIKTFRRFKSDIYFGGNKIYGIMNDCLISLIEPEHVNSKWYKKVKSSVLKKEIKNQLLDYVPSSNPIICLIKLDEF